MIEKSAIDRAIEAVDRAMQIAKELGEMVDEKTRCEKTVDKEEARETKH